MKFKLGRRRPVARCPRLALQNYLFKDLLPAPPASTNYWSNAAVALAQMYLNDQLGDCVIAGMQHVAGVLTGNSGEVAGGAMFTSDNTIRLYSAVGGYVPGNPNTDNGCDEQTALNYWVQHGLLVDGSYPIAGWTALDGGDKDQIKTALWLFENLVFGIELPDAWVNPDPGPGFVWDVAGPPVPDNGHCVVGVDFNDEGVQVCSWGMKGTITWPAVAKYAIGSAGGELYTVLGQDSISKATQKAPSGFDFIQLTADLQAIRN